MAHWKLVDIFHKLAVCQRNLRQIVKKFFALSSIDEDDQRKETLLRTVLVASFLLGLAVLAIVLSDVVTFGNKYQGIPWWLAALVPGWFGLLLYLLRRGHLRLASVGLFLAYLIPSLYSSARWGIDLPQALLSDAFLIVMTSVLFGTRAAFLSSIGIGAALFTFAVLGEEGILPVNRYWHQQIFSVGDGIMVIGTLLFMSLLCQLANREVERSLRRARASEILLREERDLLEIRVTERTSELRKTQLEQITQLHRFVEFGRMATGFFHDLASPLGAIALNLDLLQKAGLKEHKEAEQYVERAATVTRRLESFLHDVRRHIHQDQGADEHFSATEVTTAVLEVVEYHARSAGVILHCQVEPGVMITGNAIKFHKVLMNLIWNAIDAYAGLRLAAEKCVVTVDIKRVHDQVMVTVSDRGCGITPENLERIWEPFYTTKSSNQGMGIGLTVCRRVIEEDFGGTITCTSTPEHGTIFTLTLQAHAALSSTSPTTPSTA